MGNKFIPTLQTGQGYTHIKFAGILDEENQLVSLISQIQGEYLLLDMADVERINSCGVRDWVNWLNQVQALGIKVILMRCSPSVVAQANMVTNFAKDAYIHSFFAPYVDPGTGKEYSKFILTSDILAHLPIKAPKFLSESGAELEFDEFEETYFAFLQDPALQQYVMPPEIGMLVQTLVPELQKSSPMSGMGPGSQVLSSVNAAPPMPPVSSVNPVAYVSSASPALPMPSPQPRHEQPPLPSGSYRSASPSVSVSGMAQTSSGQHPSVTPRHSDARTPSVQHYAPPQNVGNNRLVFTIGVCVVVLLIVVLVVIIVQRFF